MRKIIPFLLCAVFALSLFSPKTSFAQSSPSDISGQIKKNYECGQIGQKCCKKGVDNIPELRVPSPDVPVLGTIIDILASPINTIASLADPLVNWTLDKLGSAVGREPCAEGVPSGTKNIDSCVCLKRDSFNIGKLCTGIKDKGEISRCVSCSSHGVWTAIGCVDFKLGNFVASIFGIGIGLAGGAAFLCILYSALIYQTSQGNPERLKKAREYLTSCIMGLILVIFSILILRLVGVNILGIPGFS